ncbi:HtaA domain-containing protein [Leucobacter sp. wl10]|uniref:HtaA domain-containing protein n=1 Tax=Leucobacter sp. wl10 TaxID=2304677 RepID=UPI001F0897CB|nr:HtaA domain-containing protein [Leucobacter sp. wl10]
MTPRIFRRSAAILGAAALAGPLLLMPAAPAAPAAAATGPCAVTGGTLTWGVKESFRSYISGSIANGSWEPSGGATYDTPNFQWSGATGEIDPRTGTGAVSFVGTVSFTGHDGVLSLTLSNPTVEFGGDGKAALMLDTRSNDATGKLVVDAQQEWVGDVTVEDPVAPQASKLELSKMPAVLTNSGAKAFAGFYEAGVDLDPVSVALDFEGCDAAPAPANGAGGSKAPTAAQAEEPAGAAPAASAPVPWLPIGIGAAALLVIGVTVGMLVGGRKRPAPPAAEPSDESRAGGAEGAEGSAPER